MADKPGAFMLGAILVDALAVDVVHEDFTSIFLRPGIAEINHQPGVGVSAPGCIGAPIGCVRPVFGAGIMEVIRNGGNVLVNIWVEVLPGLSLIARVLDDVKQVLN